MSKSGGNLTIQYNLRWSEDLRDKIAESAKAHNRSMNADIVSRLEESFEIAESVDSMAEGLPKLFQRIDKLMEAVDTQSNTIKAQNEIIIRQTELIDQMKGLLRI